MNWTYNNTVIIFYVSWTYDNTVIIFYVSWTYDNTVFSSLSHTLHCSMTASLLMQIHCDKIRYLVITFSLLEMFELHVFHKAWSVKLYAVYSDNHAL